MLLRITLLLVAVAAIVLLARSLDAHDRCEGGKTTVFEVLVGHLPASREAQGLSAIRQDCRGSDSLVAASAALQRQGRGAQALEYAALAVRREPDSAIAWDALAVAAQDRIPGLARRALARAQALSPLGPEPVQAPARSSRRRAGAGAAGP